MTEEIRLCIIDDVPDVVEGISRGIPWSDYGITVAGTAGNGVAGRELILQTKPHIVLTDIRMPRLDGLQMMKELEHVCPGMKTIFISGYTDFEYAQQAVRLGAFDYVIKPFHPGQIVELVLKAKAAIEEEARQAKQYREMERKLRESMPYLRQEYFQLLLQYPTPAEQAAKRWDFLNIELEREGFTVLLAEIDGFAERISSSPVQEVELIRFTLHNILEETIRSITKGFIFRDHSNRFAAIINPAAATDTEALAELCRENIAKYSKFTISLGIGEAVSHIHDIYYSYNQARTALSYNFYTGGNSVYSYRKVQPVDEAAPQYAAEKEKELFFLLRSGNLPKALDLLEELFAADVNGTAPPPDMMKGRYYELAFLMNRVFAEKLTPVEMKPLERQAHRLKDAGLCSLQDLRETVKELCSMGCMAMEQKHTDAANQVVDQVIAYIRDHLHENNTVNDYARLVFLSGSYFANLFKKVTGYPVAQFVTSERMERAKEMLAQGMAVQDIALALGYEGRQYFSELFKKHTGVTPSEFKQAYADKEK
ncbi:response regulator [Paenibacillus mesotrionivorans]|uniref:Response regulator n=1 Tax=Paenibacillus mesotrionivorans TaxID=3160968 RepID=A0ACC7P6K7_9BACL